MDIKSQTLASMKDNKFQNEDSFSIEDQSDLNTAGNQTEYTEFAGSNSTIAEFNEKVLQFRKGGKKKQPVDDLMTALAKDTAEAQKPVFKRSEKKKGEIRILELNDKKSIDEQLKEDEIKEQSKVITDKVKRHMLDKTESQLAVVKENIKEKRNKLMRKVVS
jgi:hypothetical protein